MTDKEKIRAEIERRKKFYYDRYTKKGIGCIEESRYDECVELLAFINSLPEEPVSSIWHDASEEPEDKSNCLIHYIVGGEVSYTDMFSVLYNKETREFVSEPYPHPTGNKVEQKSLEGGVVADVYKNMRDKFPLSDISQWAYLKDLIHIQEGPVSEDFKKALEENSI